MTPKMPDCSEGSELAYGKDLDLDVILKVLTASVLDLSKKGVHKGHPTTLGYKV